MSLRRLAAVLIVLGQVLLIGGLVAQQQHRLRTWQAIRLRVEPVDPISLFRGRYVQLDYDFSNLTTTEGEWKQGDTITVRLQRRRRGLWGMAEYGQELEPQAGTLLLRGEVDSVAPEREFVGEGEERRLERTGRQRVHVRAGIESYFLSERKAPEIDRFRRDLYEMTVEVVVAEDGRAALKQLYVRGVPAEEFEPPSPSPATTRD